MLLFILLTLFLTNTQYCSAETKDSSFSDTHQIESSDTNNSYSIVPSHSYQYYTNVHDDYMDSTYKPKSTEREPEESSGYTYSKPVKSSYEVPNSKVTSSNYQIQTGVGDANAHQPPQTNFYYNYYTVAPPSSDAPVYTSMSPEDAKNPQKYDTKYKAPETHSYYNYDQAVPHQPTYNDHDHYHLDQRQPEGRDADSYLPTGQGPLPPPPLGGPPSGPGPSGPPVPPPPPPPIKGSIDYILIPLILIGIAGPVFVVLYVILGAFEAKLAPIVRSLPDSTFNLSKIDLNPVFALVSRALEKYGY